MHYAGTIYKETRLSRGDEIHQLEVVFKIMGTPTPERWADVINLPWFELVKPQHPMPNRFREAFQK
jgi:CTD kinase subunit alpha